MERDCNLLRRPASLEDDMGYRAEYRRPKEDEDFSKYTTVLAIDDGGAERIYCDGGEPEDQTFYRDWSWVKDELERAYAAGLRDGATKEAA